MKAIGLKVIRLCIAFSVLFFLLKTGIDIAGFAMKINWAELITLSSGKLIIVSAGFLLLSLLVVMAFIWALAWIVFIFKSNSKEIAKTIVKDHFLPDFLYVPPLKLPAKWEVAFIYLAIFICILIGFISFVGSL